VSSQVSEARALRSVLEVTRKLGAPFDLDTMLTEVVDAARDVLDADRGTVFLYDEESDELVVKVATELGTIRIPSNKGIVGESAMSRKLINVPDCYADERFNRAIDKETGYQSRCMLTIPLIGFEDTLVGVLQILNKNDGVFDEQDEFVATALAAQAAVVLHRAKLIESMIASERLDREITVARDVQMGTLPKEMPRIEGYGFAGAFSPTDQTGGDLYLRLGAGLDDVFVNINDQLVEDLPEDRFVTAFFGLLDAKTHTVRFHSAGQGPIMHYHAASKTYDWHEPSTFPLGYMAQTNLGAAVPIKLAPGDILGLISDGIYEYENEVGLQFGQKGVASVIDTMPDGTAEELVAAIMHATRLHGGRAPQADDITIVLVRRVA
jgi:phosphoserine phosphatase